MLEMHTKNSLQELMESTQLVKDTDGMLQVRIQMEANWRFST